MTLKEGKEKEERSQARHLALKAENRFQNGNNRRNTVRRSALCFGLFGPETVGFRRSTQRTIAQLPNAQN